MAHPSTQSMTYPNTNVSNTSLSKPKPTLLGEQTAWTLLANIAYLYRHHFGVVVGCVVLPFVLPLMLLTPTFLQLRGPEPLLSLAEIAGFVLAYINLFVVPAALTVVLSDICLGNAPTLKRAFSRVLGKLCWWQLFTTSLLVGLAVGLGLILLIVPGLWLFIRSLFTVTIFVLEGQRGRDAIRRSFALTKGQEWRLTGLYLLSILAGMLVGILVGIVQSITIAMAGPESTLAVFLPILSEASTFVLSLPIGTMTLILLYYDQRVRRESYDAQALSEDLMR